MNPLASISCKSFKNTLMKTQKRTNKTKGIRLMMGFGWSHKKESISTINKAVLV